MGNKNDYLTLEESARVLDKPVSSLKTLISEGKVSAKLAGGRWLVSVRDLDKLKRSLPPEPEEIVHNFPADIPAKKQQRVPRTESTIKTRDTSPKKLGTSNPPRTKSEFKKRIKDLNKQMRKISDQIRVKAERYKKAVRSGNPASNVALNNLQLRLRQLKKQRRDIQAAWSKNAHLGKEKAKRSSSSFMHEGHRLLGQIKALDSQIKLEAARYKEAAHERKFYDIEILKSLVLQRAGLARQYARIPDPLGWLPPLPPRVFASQRKASQKKSKASKRASGQASSSDKVPLSSGLPTNRLSWSVLPAGEWSVAGIRQHYDRLQRQSPHVKYDHERIDKALSLDPEQCFIGKDEFEGYIVFTFTHTPKALLECPVFGNAIYIIHSDWKRLSRMTKQELMRSPEVTRIVHKGDWFERVKREFGIR